MELTLLGENISEIFKETKCGAHEYISASEKVNLLFVYCWRRVWKNGENLIEETEENRDFVRVLGSSGVGLIWAGRGLGTNY